jgi:ferredoxin
MEAAGYEPSAIGTFNCYEGIPDVFVQDTRDEVEVNNSVRFDTLMTDENKSIAFARDVLSLIEKR